MVEQASQDTAAGTAKPTTEDRSFLDIVKSLVGNTITVVNPASYEGAPIGYQLRTGFYRAKALGLGKDYLVVVTEFTPAGRKVSKEPVKQYIPLNRIKRLSLTKSERILHL